MEKESNAETQQRVMRESYATFKEKLPEFLKMIAELPLGADVAIIHSVHKENGQHDGSYASMMIAGSNMRLAAGVLAAVQHLHPEMRKRIHDMMSKKPIDPKMYEKFSEEINDLSRFNNDQREFFLQTLTSLKDISDGDSAAFVAISPRGDQSRGVGHSLQYHEADFAFFNDTPSQRLALAQAIIASVSPEIHSAFVNMMSTMVVRKSPKDLHSKN